MLVLRLAQITKLQVGPVSKANYLRPLNRNLAKASGTAIWSEQDLFCGLGFVLYHNVTMSLTCKVALPAYEDL